MVQVAAQTTLACSDATCTDSEGETKKPSAILANSYTMQSGGVSCVSQACLPNVGALSRRTGLNRAGSYGSGEGSKPARLDFTGFFSEASHCLL